MTEQPQRHSGAPRVIIALGIAVSIVIASVACAFYMLAVHGTLKVAHAAKEETFDSAQRIANGFKSAFNFTPQVTVNGVTEIQQANSIMELATVSQGVVQRYEWSQSWLWSTKTMELQGVYQAKAGFDLREPFLISVEGDRITAKLPEPKVLSMEMDSDHGYKILKDEEGWWNKISSTDREIAITEMQRQARAKAEQSGILSEAKARMTQQLCEMIRAQKIDLPVEITFQDGPPVAVNPEKQ